MAKVEKNYTYEVKFEKDGKVYTVNDCVKRARGYGQSWFTTETAARKGLANTISIHTMADYKGNCGKVVEWVIKDRNGIIEKGC